MTTIIITLPDERLRKLKEVASRFSMAPEELVWITIEELLRRPEEEFQRSLEYALQKNKELYRQLA